MAGQETGSRGGGRRWLSIAGAAAFLAGYIIAIIASIWWPASGGVIGLLAALGVVVGLSGQHSNFLRSDLVLRLRQLLA